MKKFLAVLVTLILIAAIIIVLAPKVFKQSMKPATTSQGQLSISDPIMTRWLGFFGTDLEKFNYVGTREVKIDSINAYSLSDFNNSEYFKLISKLSADKRYAVNILGCDMPSFNKKQDIWALAGDPDSFIYLIDLSAGKRFRMNYAGTPVAYHDFNWISNDKFYVIGIEETGGEGNPMQNSLFIDIFDVNGMEYSKYTYILRNVPEKTYTKHSDEVLEVINRTFDKDKKYY